MGVANPSHHPDDPPDLFSAAPLVADFHVGWQIPWPGVHCWRISCNLYKFTLKWRSFQWCRGSPVSRYNFPRTTSGPPHVRCLRTHLNLYGQDFGYGSFNPAS